jgi:hypothetical protein
MKAVNVIPIMALAACSVPHPLSGLRNQVTTDAGGYSFAINYSQDIAEATRLTRVWRPDYLDVQAAAVSAVIKGTGCTPDLRSVTGDVALMRMKIDCAQSATLAPPPAPDRVKASCVGNAVPFDLNNGIFDLELECD